MSDSFFSHSPSISSSVPVTFFGPRRLSEIRNDALGKRKRNQRGRQVILYEPDRELPPQKRRRFLPPEDCHCSWHPYPPASSIRPSTAQPWHQNDRFVRQLPKAELAALVDPPSPDTIPSLHHRLLFTNLNNPIHPLFRALTGLAITLPYLATSLRLATKFLISSHTLPFFHTLITTPLTLLQAESHIFNAPATWLSESSFAGPTGTGLPPVEYRLTMQTLVALTDHISIQISPDPRLATRWAYTERHTPPQHRTSVNPAAGLRQPSSRSADTSWNRGTCTPSSWHLRGKLPQLFPTPAHLHPPHPQMQAFTSSSSHSNGNQNGASKLIDTDEKQQQLRALSFRGTNALINISPLFLRMMHPHFTHSPRPQPESQTSTGGQAEEGKQETTTRYEEVSDAQRERAIFFLAITLVHELAHAVFMTRSPVLSKRNTQNPSRTRPGRAGGEDAAVTTEYEPFHSSQRSAELGHAWETSVFAGGKILSLAQDDHFGLGLGWMRWPGADSFFVRDRDGGVRAFSRLKTRGGRDGDASGRGRGRSSTNEVKILGPLKYETVYPLDWRYMRRFFLDGFWERVVHGTNTASSADVAMDTDGTGIGIQALTPPKILGSRVRNYDWINHRYSHRTGHTDNGMETDEGEDDGYSSTCSSRTRGHDVDGVVREGQVWIASDDDDDDDDDDEYGDEDEY